MKIFSSKIYLDAGLPLGGNDPSRISVGSSDQLEINGLEFTDQEGLQRQLCSVDALYAGRLVKDYMPDAMKCIFAASHTHYAPMLDDTKPKIGCFSGEALKSYIHSISQAARLDIMPNMCRMYRAEVDVPVYRRFDHPPNWCNSFLTRYGGLYPNYDLRIDRGIYIFEFVADDNSTFVMVSHACHPVSRGVSDEISSDYVGVLREAIRDRFNVDTVIFLLGCAGDVRPNITKKRISWLPKCRINWRFDSNPSASQRDIIDSKYIQAVKEAAEYDNFLLNSHPIGMVEDELDLNDGTKVQISRMKIGDKLSFTFLPFELSHLYSKELQKIDRNHFMVSCSGNTLGYLPHPTQYVHGGYEVDGSLKYMGLKERIEITHGDLF